MHRVYIFIAVFIHLLLWNAIYLQVCTDIMVIVSWTALYAYATSGFIIALIYDQRCKIMPLVMLGQLLSIAASMTVIIYNPGICSQL